MRREIALALTVALLAGCTASTNRTESGYRQGVAGVVWLRPGRDASDMTSAFEPADTTPRPIPGAPVYLMRHSVDALDSSDILAAAITDSLGRYELPAPLGAYYLAVGTTTGVSAPVLRGTPAVAVGQGFFIHALSVVEIKAGRITEHSIRIAELVPQ